MLSDRLRERPVAGEETERKSKPSRREKDARRTLNTYLRGLVEIMRAIEADKTMTRSEVEEYILDRLAAHETTYFGMSDEEFNKYMFFKQLQRDLSRG